MPNVTQINGWALELVTVQGQIDASIAEEKERRGEHREELASLRERARHLLALISGKEGEQLDLPAPKEQSKYHWCYEGKGDIGKMVAFHLTVGAGLDKKGYPKRDALCGHTLGRGGRWIGGHPNVQNDWQHVCLDCLENEEDQAAAEARAERDEWRSKTCPVPGCGVEAVERKGFCAEHNQSLSKAEQKSIVERNERLRDEA